MSNVKIFQMTSFHEPDKVELLIQELSLNSSTQAGNLIATFFSTLILPVIDIFVCIFSWLHEQLKGHFGIQVQLKFTSNFVLFSLSYEEFNGAIISHINSIEIFFSKLFFFFNYKLIYILNELIVILIYPPEGTNSNNLFILPHFLYFYANM